MPQENKIVVQKGSEKFRIPASDVAYAMQNGYKVVTDTPQQDRPSGLEPFGGKVPQAVSRPPIQVGAAEQAEAQRLSLADPRIRAAQQFDPVAAIDSLPSSGAVLGSAMGPVGGAAGAAGGEAMRQMVRTAGGLPPTQDRLLIPRLAKAGTASGVVEDAVLEGLTNAGIDAAFRAGRWGVKSGMTRFKKTLNREQAGQMVAGEMGGTKMTPARFGENVQEGFDTALDLSGKAKQSVVDQITATAPKLKVRTTNTLQVLDEEIANLKRSIDEGRMSKENGGRAEGLLEVLHNRRRAIAIDGATAGNMKKIDAVRSDFFKAAQEADPSEAHRISSRLSHAAHQDIVGALDKAGMANERQMWEAASTRFRKVSEVAEATAQLRSIFGEKRVTPSEVVTALNRDPETSLKMLQRIQNDPQATATIRRSLFEDLVAKGTLPDVRDDVLEAVFQKDYQKVRKFADLLKEIRPKETALDYATIRGPGGMRLGGNPSLGGKEGKISAVQMAEILDNPLGLSVAEQLIQTPAGSQQAANLTKVFMRLVESTTKNRKEK